MHARRTIRILALLLLAVAACTRTDETQPGRRFVVLGAAVVRDAQTGFEWTRRDDGAGLDWYHADAYCRALSIDDAGPWRLPAIEELRTLYGATTPIPCGDAKCAIDPAFTLTSPYVWSATVVGAVARTYLDFQFGTELSPTIAPHLVRAVLCVRAPAHGAA